MAWDWEDSRAGERGPLVCSIGFERRFFEKIPAEGCGLWRLRRGDLAEIHEAGLEDPRASIAFDENQIFQFLKRPPGPLFSTLLLRSLILVILGIVSDNTERFQ